MQQHPDIILTPKTRAYLQQHGVANLSLELRPLLSCCVPYTPPPHISFGLPRRPAQFITMQRDGITIHLDRALSNIPRLTIDQHGFSIFSWLSVSDWRPLPPSS